MNIFAALRLPPFFRFLITGGINTVVTYGVYLTLLQVMSYQLSYTIAFVSGIVIQYTLSRAFVFQSHKGMKSILLFPMVYMVQYGIGIFILWVTIDIAGIDDRIAPLIVIVVTVPITYLLSRFVFVSNNAER